MNMNANATVKDFYTGLPTKSEAAAFNTYDTHAPPRPRFQLDPASFLKLPEGKSLGMVMCVDISPNGHIWIAHACLYVTPGFPDTPKDRESRLPEVVEFDAGGNYLQSWGGADYLPKENGVTQWPGLIETITIDSENCVWIFGSRRDNDHAALRFSRDGKLLLRLGQYGVKGNDESRDLLGCPTDVYLDAKSREAFLSDGYTNHRVAAFNVDTGEFVRSWGAYGKPLPTPPGPESFADPVHAIKRGPDGYLYVCDRINNRIQVFDAIGRKDAKFIRELSVAPETRGVGAAAHIAFSPDGAYMYITDNGNICVWIACMRTWKVIGWFAGRPAEGTGNTPAVYYIPHRLVADRQGNLLVARVSHGLERWIFQGVS
jgi:hypothetical protein